MYICNTYIYAYICIHIYMYIYMEREKERERMSSEASSVPVTCFQAAARLNCTAFSTCKEIYIGNERERDTERERIPTYI